MFQAFDAEDYAGLATEMCQGTFTEGRIPVYKFRGGAKPDTCMVICPQCMTEQGAVVRKRDGEVVIVRINFHEKPGESGNASRG